MSGRDLLECWESTSPQPPPELLVSLLRDEEVLLWTARISSARTANRHFREGAVLMVGVLVFIFLAPWSQTVAEYCGPEPSGRCTVFAYIVWPGIAFVAASMLLAFWRALNVRYRPWVMAYGLTDRRALFVDEPNPKALSYIYLRLHPARLGPSGRVVFEGTTRSFVGLDTQAAKRALHWATEVRQSIPRGPNGGTP
jgi:hypothetical protein